MATTSLVAADARPVPPTITGVAPWWLGVSLVVTGAALVYAWRQRRLLRERLRSAAISESRLQHLFDYAPVSMLEEDFSSVVDWLAELRTTGVTDLRAHLAAHEDEVRRHFVELKVVLANRMAMRAVGAETLDQYQTRLQRLITPEVRLAFEEELVAVWEGRTELLLDIVYQRPDGQETHAALHWSVPVVGGAPDYSRVQLVFTDITELRRVKDQLRESEDRWQLAVRGMNAGLWERDFTTGRSFYSQRSSEIIGYFADELDDRPETWEQLIHPEDREGYRQALRDYLERRSPEFRVEQRMCCKDGRYRWVLSRGQALFDDRGQPLRIVGTYSDIDARKSAENALRESEARLRRIVTYADCLLWQARIRRHPDGAWSWYFELAPDSNRSGLHRLRSPANDARMLWGDAYLPDFAAMGETSARALEAGESGYRHEYRVVRDNETVWVSENVEVEQIAPDEWTAVGVVMDITAGKRSEEALRASEERWKMAFRGSQDGIWEYSYETGESYYSDRWKEMLGYAPDEIGNTREEWIDRIHPEDRPRVIKAFNDHLQGRTPNYGVEFRMRCRDDTYKWILARGLVVSGADGRPLRSAGSHTDITERKAAEAALAAERERLSVTLRAMTEGVITTDRHGVIQYLNQAAETLTGWLDGAAIGRDFADVCSFLHPHTKAPLPPLAATAMREARVVDLPPASILTHRQGVSVLVEGRCAPIRDASSLPVGVVLVLHDVTERSRLEAEMLRATKLESVGVLAGGIAHDFNNLLTVVMGNLTLAMLDSQVMAAAGSWLQEAEKGLVRARDLTQQLLTFSRGGEPVRSAVQLGVVVREAAEFCLHGAKVKCAYTIEPDLWAAEVDQGQIGQVVQNLVINAVQAMPEGGRVSLELHNDPAPPVRTGLESAAIRLTITDTGHGIPADRLERIFDPYFTTKKEGTGLGLATVYSIIKKHGGHIEVESKPGGGTCFRFWLPASRAAVTPAIPTAPTGDVLGGRVLFMDDEETIRSMAGTLLTRMGFDVVAVADGAAAVQAYTEALGTPKAFNLVITDLTVPGGMGGRELMERLLKLDPGVKAIVSSGYSSDPVMADFKAYGFKGMVPKPYRITDLAKTIRQVLEG